jgi:hypothetical protein
MKLQSTANQLERRMVKQLPRRIICQCASYQRFETMKGVVKSAVESRLYIEEYGSGPEKAYTLEVRSSRESRRGADHDGEQEQHEQWRLLRTSNLCRSSRIPCS